jgi:hypothetical protein
MSESKVSAAQLRRAAVVYVRQSTMEESSRPVDRVRWGVAGLWQ